MRTLARRLMAYEAKANRSSATRIPAAFQVCERLRPHLATLTGNAGFRALVVRALALAKREDPGLCAVHVTSDGTLALLEGSEAQVPRREVIQGGVTLLAQLLGLLVEFIGEKLTLRLLREVWPKLSLEQF
jgi:hypothetical protein